MTDSATARTGTSPLSGEATGMSLDFRLAACLFGHMDHRDYDTWMDRAAAPARRGPAGPRVPDGLRRPRRAVPADAVLVPASSDSRQS